MDPNATLGRLLNALADYSNADTTETLLDAAEEMHESARDLHDWLRGGGFLPTAWEREGR